jgi:acetyl-CoA carboxylase biotin carboxyl carrier protein
VNEPVLLVRVEPVPGGLLQVRSPGIGWWTDHPHAGALLGPGSRAGILAHLNRRFALVVPEGHAGRLAGGLPRDRAVPVEYGQTLFTLLPVEAGAAATGPASGIAGLSAGAAGPGASPGAAGAGAIPGGAGAPGLPPGARAIASPTDGVFYLRPSPGARPFVGPGATIRTGQVVGLVEVMKTFNQILYGGPGYPPEAEVLEVRRGDGQEVRAGDVLIVVR